VTAISAAVSLVTCELRRPRSPETWKLIQFAGDSNAGLPQHVRHLGLAQPRGVVFKGQPVLLFVNLETTQPIGIRELAEAIHLLEAERRLQFVRDFEECHARDYSSPHTGALDAR